MLGRESRVFLKPAGAVNSMISRGPGCEPSRCVQLLAAKTWAWRPDSFGRRSEVQQMEHARRRAAGGVLTNDEASLLLGGGDSGNGAAVELEKIGFDAVGENHAACGHLGAEDDFVALVEDAGDNVG